MLLSSMRGWGKKNKCRTQTESSEKERQGIMCVVVSVRHAEKKMGKTSQEEQHGEKHKRMFVKVPCLFCAQHPDMLQGKMTESGLSRMSIRMEEEGGKKGPDRENPCFFCPHTC